MDFRISQSVRLYLGMGLLACSLVGSLCFSEESPPASTPPEDSAAQMALQDAKAEMEIGRTMAGRLLAFYGTFEDNQLTTYINQVGNFVAKAGNFPQRRYMFAVLDSDSVNAFACPGGYILITKGTIKHARTEAELAAVLGHEAAHVGLQHMFSTLKKMGAEDAKKLEEEAEGRKLKDDYAMARKRPAPEDSAAGTAIANFLASAGGGGLSVLQAAKAGMSMILEKGLDQKFEFEADAEGAKYAIRAGYNPKGLDDFLSRLAQEKKKTAAGEQTVMDKTHPSIQDRRKSIATALQSMSPDQIVGAVLQKRYQGFQSRVLKKSKSKKEKDSVPAVGSETENGEKA